MRKVHRPGPDPPAPHSRSDSFVRMLELEKMCKMKRVQQDHGSSSSTYNPSRASFPSVTANPAAPRSRRASDYPPLSHQTQIMKAVRRSAALPSLSLSIPPSPTQAMTMRSEGSVEELSLAKEERAKTVTFSEPEDDGLSDNSSICQSPSWEQYGQKKKKKPKKGANQKNTKKADDTAFKKKSNRLTKSAPIDPFTATPLASSDRSISAPDLGLSAQPNRMDSHPLMAEAQVALGKHRTPRNDPSSTANGKPKSRGFLSGFRLPHGNAAAVQKPAEERKGAEDAVGQNEPLRSIQYETLPVQQPNAARLAVNQNISKPKKAPSIRSVISTSDHSLSSQEKRNSGAHTSTSSGHGRSQSLLSSTLNKLRGPSYLYYQPSGDESVGDPSKHADNLQDINALHSNATGVLNGQNGDTLEERDPSSLEHAQQPFDFSFPPKFKRVHTEPGPDIAPRGRQPRPRRVETQPPNFEQGVTVLRPPVSRRVQIESPKVPTQDTVMALVTAQEKRSQAARMSQQTRSNIAGGKQALDPMRGHQSGRTEVGGKRTVLRNQRGDVHRHRNEYGPSINVSSAELLDEEETTSKSNRNDRLNVRDGHVPEDDEVSIGTYASTIRPVSQSHEGTPGENRTQQKLPRTDSPESHDQAAAPTGMAMGTKTERFIENHVDDLITFERDVPDTLQQPLQPYREVDYFASFSDSYLPPLVDLRSSNNGKLISPRFPPSEESDEEGGQGVLHGGLENGHTKRAAIADRGEKKASHAISSLPKDSSKPSDEPKLKSSPAISTQYSDSDVPAFERLGLSSKAAKILSGAETASTSTVHSQQTDPSRATSERSSSSTCDDSPPSPSSATTPDSSRPQSRKGVTISQEESSQITWQKPTARPEGGVPYKNFRNVLSERSEERTLRRVGIDLNADGGSWSEAATTPNVDQQTTPTLARVGGLAGSPSLVATPTSVTFANVLTRDLEEESEQGVRPSRPLPPRAQSALDLHSTTKFKSNSSRIQRLHLKPNEELSSISLPSSPPADMTEEVMPRKSALKMSRNNSSNGAESSTAISMGAAYLQEARKAAPVATTSSSRALRPHFLQKNSSGSIRSAVSTGNRAEPLAKMLVECCSCHFFHDMPSRVYECMAKPDSVVEDKSLGVSAAITTMVRCPWCAHGMTTQCCSGYAAVVYLKEKLHGK